MFEALPQRSLSPYATGLFWLVVLLFAGMGPDVAFADAPPPGSESSEFREPETTEEQQRTVTIAIYLLVALTVGVVSLLILIMLWGARVRRQVRKPLPTMARNDPLWYLKSPKSPREPEPPPGVSEGETPSASD